MSLNWHPVDQIPDALKDGRELLLWNGYTVDIAKWRSMSGQGWLESDSGTPVDGATLYAELDGDETLN